VYSTRLESSHARLEETNVRLEESNTRLEVAVQKKDVALDAAAASKRQAETLLYFNRILLAEREWTGNNIVRAKELLRECPEERRGWEWRYLDRLCRLELASFRAHSGWAGGLTYSPDGRVLATASFDGMMKFWGPTSGQQLRTFRGDTGALHYAAFSPDGKRLATSSCDGHVTVWDPATGQDPLTLREHKDGVAEVAVSADGGQIASAGYDGIVRVWTRKMARSCSPSAGTADQPSAWRSARTASDRRETALPREVSGAYHNGSQQGLLFPCWRFGLGRPSPAFSSDENSPT
jgi:WD40 repeat protein